MKNLIALLLLMVAVFGYEVKSESWDKRLREDLALLFVSKYVDTNKEEAFGRLAEGGIEKVSDGVKDAYKKFNTPEATLIFDLNRLVLCLHYYLYQEACGESFSSIAKVNQFKEDVYNNTNFEISKLIKRVISNPYVQSSRDCLDSQKEYYSNMFRSHIFTNQNNLHTDWVDNLLQEIFFNEKGLF